MFPTLLDLGELGFLGRVTLPSYFVMMMVGYAFAVYLAWRDSRRVGIDPENIIDIGLYALIFGVIGARLLHVVADGFFMDYVNLCLDPIQVDPRDLGGYKPDELTQGGITPRLCSADTQCFEAHERGVELGPNCNEETGYCYPDQDCFRWAYFWAGGLAYYGGFLGAATFLMIFMARHRVAMKWAPKLSTLSKPKSVANIPVIGSVARFFAYFRKFPYGPLFVADLSSPGISLAQAFGRFGCYLAGCCFGAPTDSAVGVQFPGGSQVWRLHRIEQANELSQQTQALGEHLSLPVHPTQLYSAISNFGIFLFLWFIVRRYKRFHGQVFLSMLLAYGSSRFIIEFWRADFRGEFFGLSTSQLISIPVLALGAWGMWKGLSSSKGLIDDTRWPPLDKPLVETVYKPHDVMWDGEQVAPVPGWKDDLRKLLERIWANKTDIDKALGEAQPEAEPSQAAKAPASDPPDGDATAMDEDADAEESTEDESDAGEDEPEATEDESEDTTADVDDVGEEKPEEAAEDEHDHDTDVDESAKGASDGADDESEDDGDDSEDDDESRDDDDQESK